MQRCINELAHFFEIDFKTYIGNIIFLKRSKENYG